MDSDLDKFITDEADDGFELNLEKSSFKKPKRKMTEKKGERIKGKKRSSVSVDSSGKNLIDVFALYGNMDQRKRVEILTKYCQSDSGVLICTVRR